MHLIRHLVFAVLDLLPRCRAACSALYAFAITTLLFGLSVSHAQAGLIPLGAASDYAVLYEGTGGNTLHITNVTINGNVGVGGTGQVSNSGPSTVNGRIDFSAGNVGQYSAGGSNVGPTSVNYQVGAVTSALSTINSLSSSLSGGTSLAINGTQTINESAGTLATVNGTTYRLFNVTSYSENDGNLVTINGDGSGNPVVFNFSFSSDVNLGGDVALAGGLTDDQVLWNFTTSGKNISLNNNASSFPLPLAYQGILLAPNDLISLVNANLDGRVFGGDSGDMQIVSGDTINAPSSLVPEPPSIQLLGFGGVALVVTGLWSRRFQEFVGCLQFMRFARAF
jgi:hypothetical protein